MRSKIRRAEISDAAEILRLTTQLGYPVTSQEISQRLQLLLPLSTQFVAIAESSDCLLGWVSAAHCLTIESGKQAELTGLVVDGEARRLGIGKSLVLAAEDWAAEQGLTTIRVRSNIARSASHPFYESIGYARTKTQHTYVKRLAIRQESDR